MIEVRSADKVRVLSIHYLIQFKKDIINIKTLFDSSCEINIITPVYVLKLDFRI